MAVPVAVGGVLAGLGGVLKLADNPVVAWLLVLGVLFIDSNIGYFFGFSGAIGSAFSWVVSGLSGSNIIITSFHLMVIIAIVGVILLGIKLRK